LSEVIRLFHNRKNIVPVVISVSAYIFFVILVNTLTPVAVEDTRTNDSNNWYQARAIKNKEECLLAGFEWKKQSYNSGEVEFYCSSES
jgi:hypothetical protein